MKSMFYVEEEMRAFPEVDWRYIVMPTHSLKGETIPLDFSPESLAYNILHGEEDGRDAVKNKVNAKDLVAKLKKQILDQYMHSATTFNKV